MRIAIVLFGQPRNYKEGYRQIQTLCNLHPTCTFEFYYHCWTLPHGTSFKMSPHVKVDPSHLLYHEDTPRQLEALYHPILCEYTDQNMIVHSATLIHNQKNIFDQMYSRTKARDILVQAGRRYDRVIMTRFDINTPIQIDLLSSDESVYIQSLHLPRSIFSDHTLMATQDVFCRWFDLYPLILDLQQDPDVKQRVESYHEKVIINAEELLFASYLFHFKTLDKIKYFNGGYRT